MSRLIAAFESPEALIKGARKLKAEGFSVEDALTPFRVEELERVLGFKAPLIRRIMAAAGFSVAAAMYGTEFFSAVIAYPLNSGGRPLNSWQVFFLVPFEAGILAAGLAGFIAFLAHCGFPSLYHPLFEAKGVERATLDRFFLIVDADKSVQEQLRNLLAGEGAVSIEEVP